MFSFSEYKILEKVNDKGNVLLYRAERYLGHQKFLLKVVDCAGAVIDEKQAVNECQIVSSLSHKGIAAYLKVEASGSSIITIIENANGIMLEQYLQGYKISVASALKIAISIAEVLEYLGNMGLVHQGLYPGNVIIDPATLAISFIDFSAMLPLDKIEEAQAPVPVELALLPYISPEQTGRIKEKPDGRSDLYSLGIIFYEMLTGSVPFESKDPLSLIHSHIAKSPLPPEKKNINIPQCLSQIVIKLLSKNATARYQSPYGLKVDLQACLSQWATNGNIQLAQLGRQDFSGRLQKANQFYGRADEIASLHRCYKRVKEGKTGIVLVEGYSGVGKSSLVHQLRGVIILQQGAFVKGKFNQFQRNIPYYAFIQAFKEYTGLILTGTPEGVSFWKEKILNAVGVNGRVLTEIIPHLELLIGPQPALPELELNETQNRLHFVFTNFIKCLSQKEHPLVIFFDDVQWADAASSNLLKIILTDNSLQNFLFIGAYRENEIGMASIFSATIGEVKATGVYIEKIVVSTLPYKNVEDIVNETLSGKVENNSSLVQLVYNKSHGNPFFINAFLKCLYQEKILVFNFTSHKWQWDEGKIYHLRLSENIVELLMGRLQKLSVQTQQVLKSASCLSYHFDVRLLMAVLQQTRKEIDGNLEPALNEGLILIAGENYRFAHDRIQQAAYSLIGDTLKTSAHLTIGRALLQNLSAKECNMYVFEIVNQLNAGIALINDATQKYQLAELNLTAGIKAKSSAAYRLSFEYFQLGISLLSVQAWQTHYKLTLQLYTEGAEAGFLSGNTVLMNQWAGDVLNNAENVLDKVKAYEVRIKYYIAGQQLLNAVETSLQILKLLNINFPASPGKGSILLALAKIKMSLAGRPLSALASLPLIKNENAEAAIRILANVGSAAYFAMPKLFPLFVCKAFLIMVKYGNSPYSGAVCASYGVIVLGGIGNINEGYLLGKIAIELSEKFETSSFKYQCGMMVNNFIIHWKEPLRNILAPLYKNYWDCLETGNTEFASLSAELYCFNSFFCGKGLKVLTEEMMKFMDAIQQLKQEIPLSLHKIHTQAVLNLQVIQTSPFILTGKVHQEEAMVKLYKEIKAENLLFDVYLCKLMLAYIFEKYTEAEEFSDEAESRMESALATPEIVIFYFYATLNKLAILADALAKRAAALLSAINKNIVLLRKFANKAPANCRHKLLLVEAEFYRATKRPEAAALYYDEAIREAKKNDYLNDEALACGLAAKFYEERDRELLSKHYFLQAYKCYQQWGALAKLRDMELKYAYLKEEGAFPIITTNNLAGAATPILPGVSQGSLGQLDLYSIMKAATAISSEVKLGELLKKLVKVSVENTGAQQGYLILKKEEGFYIEAQGSIYGDGEEVSVQSVLIQENKSIVGQAVQFVYLTKENLVISNAGQYPQFYLEPTGAARPKSILCTPIIHQGEVIGLLYFENDLMYNAFTPERVELLKLLSGQMAVSLQNALNEEKKASALIEKETLLAQINLHQQELLKTKLEIQEQTLNNISAEIHDNIGQTLSFIKLNINTIDVYAPDAAQKKLFESKTLLTKVIQDLRDLARSFNNDFINQEGLADSIGQQLNFLKKTGLYTTSMHVMGNQTKYGAQHELVIFRIVQEILNNIVKHAEATAVEVAMRYEPEKLAITVVDNGKGFDIEKQFSVQQKGLGLSSIHNRIALIGGTISYYSKPQNGTTVTIELPGKTDV